MLNHACTHRDPVRWPFDSYAEGLVSDPTSEVALPLTYEQQAKVIGSMADFAFGLCALVREVDRLRGEAWSHEGDLTRYTALDEVMALLAAVQVPEVDVQRMEHDNWLDQIDEDD